MRPSPCRNSSVYANAAAEQLFGREAGDLVGSELGTPLVVGETTELELVRPDGGRRHVELRSVANLAGSQQRMLASLCDVTEHREAQRRLADSERRYQLLAENTTDLISQHGSDGRIQYAGAAATRLFAMDPNELLGQPLVDLAHPEDRAAVAGLFLEEDADDEPRQAAYRLRSGTGHFHQVETTCRLVPSDAGDNVFVAVTRDVTRQKDLEQQLQRAQRMEAVGRLAGGVATPCPTAAR